MRDSTLRKPSLYCEGFCFLKREIMTIREIRGELRKSPMSAWYFIQGSIRLWLYQINGTRKVPTRPREWTRWMIRKHIAEQFEWRKKKAEKCYFAGACKCCGCKTPAVFFANKACVAGDVKKYPDCQKNGLTQCYPRLQNKRDWERLYKNS